MMRYERLATPREHLGLLIEPEPGDIFAALAQDREAALAQVQILDRPLTEWRNELRAALGYEGPVIVTGHQAEFFHAGVFAKNIATFQLAQRLGGTPVFITVDSDLPKGNGLAIPEITPGGLRTVHVELPELNLHKPMECQARAARKHWLDFFVRLASTYEHYDQSALRTYADAWLEAGADDIDVCAAVERGTAAVETALGLPGLRRITISRLCATPAFRAFALHFALHAGRLAEAYNAAQRSYRRRHHVRTANRPVPPLHVIGERVELPFWVFRCAGPRERLFVESLQGALRFFAGRTEIGTIAAGDATNAEQMNEPLPFEANGWALRPRALTLSAFARLFLADVFIHGIGGAKYDEATDEYVRSFLGAEPPPIACVTATLHLPLPRTNVSARDVAEARRQVRDVRFNPDRYVRNPTDVLLDRREALIERSNHLRERHPRDHAERRVVFNDIRRVNEELLALDPWREAELERQLTALRWQHEQELIARGREYFFALHLRSTLEQLVTQLGQRFSGE